MLNIRPPKVTSTCALSGKRRTAMDYLRIPTGIPELDRHLEHVENVDWASTPLGPLDQWPSDMASLLYQVMIDPFPKLLLLGETNNMLYNPAYGEMAGEHHPRLLGLPVLEGWAGQEDVIMKVQNMVVATGKPFIQDDFSFLYKRNSVYEEILLRWCTAPLKGSIPGYHVSLDDVTEARVNEKRRALLRSLSEDWSHAPDLAGLWTALSNSLASHEQEFPFSLLYAVTSPSGCTDSFIDDQDSSRFFLREFSGDESARPLVKGILDLDKDGKNSYMASLRQAIARKDDVLVLNVGDGNVPEAWIRAAKRRDDEDDLINVVVCPIRSNRTARVVGLLVLGLNTRRPWNEAYQSWIADCGRKINDCVTSILLADEVAWKHHETAKQAEREQVLLAKELASREREASSANDKAVRLLKMMEACDVGMFEYSPDGKLMQANVRQNDPFMSLTLPFFIGWMTSSLFMCR